MSLDGGELVEIENCPVKTSVHEIELGETVKSVVISKYSNKIQILITADSGKVSVLYEASKSKGVQVNPNPIHDVNCLFGVESEPSLVAARILSSEIIQADIPLVLGFGIDQSKILEDPSNIKKLVEFIKKCL